MDQRAADLARGANNADGTTRDLKNCVVARIKNMASLRLALVAVGTPAWLTTTAYEDACREAVGLIPDNTRNRDDLAMNALTYLMAKNFDHAEATPTLLLNLGAAIVTIETKWKSAKEEADKTEASGKRSPQSDRPASQAKANTTKQLPALWKVTGKRSCMTWSAEFVARIPLTRAIADGGSDEVAKQVWATVQQGKEERIFIASLKMAADQPMNIKELVGEGGPEELWPLVSKAGATFIRAKMKIASPSRDLNADLMIKAAEDAEIDEDDDMSKYDQQSPTPKTHSVTTTKSASPAPNNNSSGTFGGYPKVWCKKCGLGGHENTACGVDPTKKTCSKCGKMGHGRWLCPDLLK